ncbi:MAG: sigma-70 family RNA polymerase sigma factor [Sorangiineae bacterium]|nr:sigma-70 family RNA polymerase sigma factor [Polyangiaceae bacterium]MEB2323980.1 sigma-70 family RNA polymerase sigma factor [Sorangiineae bacterium]
MISSSRTQATDFEREALSHLGSLMAVGTRLTKSPTEAEDLVQDTFVKAIRARGQFEAGTNMRAWLLRILTNTFINRYRRGGLEKSVLEGPDADPLADGWVSASTMEAMRDPESQALRPVLEGEIRDALDELPDEFRLAVVLADVEELSYREIADVMGCPVGTVMSRLHRGRRLLKARLYEHARAMGIVGPEPSVGHGTPGEAESRSSAPVDMASYRRRKEAVG